MQDAFDDASRSMDWAGSSRHAVAVALIRARDWLAWLPDARGMLSVEEVERVRRKRVPGDGALLTLAYSLHRLLLGEMLGRCASQVPLDRDERGCPRVGALGVHTSLSHSEGLVAVAMTRSGPVGIDIEPTSRSTGMLDIAHCICHPSESAALAPLDDAHRNAALLHLWVRKEAALKAAGVGLAVSMESFTATVRQRWVWPIAGETAFRVRMLDAGDQSVAAVAAHRDVDVRCSWLHPAADGSFCLERARPLVWPIRVD